MRAYSSVLACLLMGSLGACAASDASRPIEEVACAATDVADSIEAEIRELPVRQADITARLQRTQALVVEERLLMEREATPGPYGIPYHGTYAHDLAARAIADRTLEVMLRGDTTGMGVVRARSAHQRDSINRLREARLSGERLRLLEVESAGWEGAIAGTAERLALMRELAAATGATSQRIRELDQNINRAPDDASASSWEEELRRLAGNDLENVSPAAREMYAEMARRAGARCYVGSATSAPNQRS